MSRETEDLITSPYVRMSKSNSSGIRGVSWFKRTKKWSAQLVFNRYRYFLGYYDSKEDAAKTRKEAEKQVLSNTFFEWYKNSYCGGVSGE